MEGSRASLLQTRVARRIFLLFFLCALIPIGALAALSYYHVARQLREQGHQRLQQATKSVGMGIVERLSLAEAELKVLGATFAATPAGTPYATVTAGLDLGVRFGAVALARGLEGLLSLYGDMETPAQVSPLEAEHLSMGRAALRTLASPSGSDFMMGWAVDRQDLSRGVMWGIIDPDYLWFAGQDASVLPPATELCVLDQLVLPMACTRSFPEGEFERLAPQFAVGVADAFEWRDDELDFLAAYRAFPIGFSYLMPQFTVILSEPSDNVLAPMLSFRQTFPAAVLLALWGVLLLSNVQIRRSLNPLRELREGTLRIAERDFTNPVSIRSGDEFEDLAASFNTMAGQLQRQFTVLTASSEIDRAILSSLAEDRIMETVKVRAREVVPSDGVSITLVDDGVCRPAGEAGGLGRGPDSVVTHLSKVELEELGKNREHLMMEGPSGARSYLRAPVFAGFERASFLVLPVFLHEELTAIITLGRHDGLSFTGDELRHGRQLANQVAVGLSNARLIERLDALQIGAITALARTIDAKSSWTAGHSERVTEMALRIGRKLDLGEDQLTDLRRGSLLHDIGKIAVPGAILDNPGKLTVDEMRIMQGHVPAGVRILEPVLAFAPIIPIVAHHHERMDGTGYPNGLAGEDIHYLARILMVADVFDALRSERPYRGGWSFEKVMGMIRQEAGDGFDASVVSAFVATMKESAHEEHVVQAASVG